MISGRLRSRVGAALVVLAVALFVVPALVPVQPVLVHTTWADSQQPPEQLRQENIRVVAYENLTERGQELYVGALENDGEYRVPEGEGASAFVYATDADRRGAMESRNMTAAGRIVIERPADDSSLPAADERYYPREEGLNETEREQRREQALRYDLMRTSKEQPPLGSPPQLLRLGAVVFAVIFLGTGGYFLSSKG